MNPVKDKEIKQYIYERHRISERVFNTNMEPGDYESVFIDFLEDAHSERFNYCLEMVAAENESKREMVTWFRQNISKFVVLENFPSLSEHYIGMMFISKLYFQVLYLNLENLTGLDDPNITRLIGLGFYKEAHIWREHVNSEEDIIDVINYSLFFNKIDSRIERSILNALYEDRDYYKALVSISERIFRIIKDINPRELSELISVFLENAKEEAELYRQYSSVRIEDLNPQDIMVYARLLTRMFRLQEAVEALEYIQLRHKGFDDMAGVYDALGQAYTLMKRYDDAMKMFHCAIDSNPKNAEYYYHLGVLYMAMNAIGHAYFNMEIAAKRAQDADIKADAERYLCAIQTRVEEIVSNIPYMDSNLFLKTDVLYFEAIQSIKNDNIDDAIDNLKTVVRNYPDNVRAMSQLALCYILKARFDEAEEILKRAVAIDPYYIPAQRNLANLNEIRKEYDRDKDYLRRLREHLIAGMF